MPDRVMQELSHRPPAAGRDDRFDVAIVGGGPTGIACGLYARRSGLKHIVLERETLVNSIVNYPVGMRFFSTTDRLSLGGLPFTSPDSRPTRSEAIRYYRSVADAEQVTFRQGVEVRACAREEDGFRLTTSDGDIWARHVILATGYFDRTNRLDVPGEDRPHVSHYYDEPWSWYDRDVAVIGGRNSAIEAALELYRAGARVTVVHRGPELGGKIKYWLRPDFDNRVADGDIELLLNSVVESIDERHLTVRNRMTGELAPVPAERVYALIGYRPDQGLFDRFGISFDPDSLVPVYHPETFETDVEGLFLAGSVACGCRTWEIFIENGREHAERVIDVISERLGREGMENGTGEEGERA